MSEHLTENQMAETLEQAAAKITIGGRYQHYKGNFYTVEGVALTEATMEPAIIYRAAYNPALVFIRPISDWLATVEVDGRTTPRFALAAEDPGPHA